MTKKDYIALSRLFTGLKHVAALSGQAVALTIMARLINTLAKDNPNFDADRFHAACKKEFER